MLCSHSLAGDYLQPGCDRVEESEKVHLGPGVSATERGILELTKVEMRSARSLCGQIPRSYQSDCLFPLEEHRVFLK